MSPTDDKDNPDPTAESMTVIQVAKGTRTKSKVLSASTKTVWKSNDDAVLVATLLKEREEGHQSDSGFKPKSFVTCAEALKGSEQTSGGIAKTSGSCHDHWGKLKKDFAVVKKLREQSGFGWDNTLKIVTAPPDVWEKYLETHKKAKVWRRKPFPLYDSIQILVEGIVATGENVFRVGVASTTDAIDTTQPLHDLVDSGEENRMSDHAPTTDEEVDGLETPIKHNNRKRSAAEMTPFISLSSRKRQPTGRSIRRSASGGRGSGTDAMFSVAGAIETLADKFDESGGVASPERRRAAIHRLEEDDDLSETEQVAAVRLFSRKTTIADSYLAIKKKSTRTRYIQSELVDFQAL